MNALKHMEVIFGAVLALACVLAVVPGELDRPAPRAAAPAPAMQVVVVKGKRMTALEKQQSLASDDGRRNPAAGT
jgi:hypothetical protein